MKNSILIFLGLLIGFTACQEEVQLDLPQNEPKLVVEAEITNTPGPHTVRLSLTQAYFSQEDEPPMVDDAEVIIRDDAGHADTLSQAEPGIYITGNLEGVVGRTYTLEINWQGNRYQSSGQLLEEAVIDSLNYRYFPANPIFEEGYYIFFFGRVPPGRTNYFRFKIYENDSLYNSASDILVQDDQFLADTIENVRLGYPFDAGDTVRLEMFTLNQDMYQYYLELITLLYNDGGMFSSPPQNPISNIRNLSDPDNPPLGYFQVASYSSGTVIIDEEED